MGKMTGNLPYAILLRTDEMEIECEEVTLMKNAIYVDTYATSSKVDGRKDAAALLPPSDPAGAWV